MYLHELTAEQQDFAETNHNLIYGFLRGQKLPTDDYYDVVVFGYLRAVRQYCSQESLRQKYAFTTIANRKMRDDLYKHYKKQSLPKRRAATVSLEALLYGEETLAMSEVVPGRDRAREDLDARLLWEQLSCLLTDDQAEALRLRADGYTDREIAARRKRRVSDVKGIFEEIQAAALGLCLA